MTLAHKAALARNAPDELQHIPIALALEPPEDDHPGYAESICRELAQHAHPNVRGQAEATASGLRHFLKWNLKKART